ncbi:MAG: hypothetical protein GXO33_09040 [Epsilonproteobacteria bacterium]|nr:hypothetical protein [Campylobacterota bacterium]
MLRVLLLLILLLDGIYAATLLNVNLYERQNRVDLMLSFDTPFKGPLKKRTASDRSIAIVLENVKVTTPYYKSLRHPLVASVAVTKSGEESALVKILPRSASVGVQASRTVDGFGLRLRIYPLSGAKKSPLTTQNETVRATTNDKPLKLKSGETLPGWRYWAVMALLLLMAGALWMIRKKMLFQTGKSGDNWLMPKNLGAKLPAEATVRFQKALDNRNKLMLVEYGGRQYLLVVGNGNLLLDRFGESEGIESEDEFVQVFEANRQRLDRFIQSEMPDAYEAFKANASREEIPKP